MSTAYVPLHRPNGRIRGSYVYLVMCLDGGRIIVKVGLANDPLKRLQELMVSCPFEPQLLATCEFPGRLIACRAENALHKALARWHSRGEWFVFAPEDREAFNAAWKPVLSEFASPSWPVRWTKISLRPVLARARSVQHYMKVLHARRRPVQRDFDRHQRE